ncbi:MAG TPA: hypothetical protein VI542_25995 [Candidatus Tectomicrobia bacterium]
MVKWLQSDVANQVQPIPWKALDHEHPNLRYGNDSPEIGPFVALAKNPAPWRLKPLLILKGF